MCTCTCVVMCMCFCGCVCRCVHVLVCMCVYEHVTGVARILKIGGGGVNAKSKLTHALSIIMPT